MFFTPFLYLSLSCRNIIILGMCPLLRPHPSPSLQIFVVGKPVILADYLSLSNVETKQNSVKNIFATLSYNVGGGVNFAEFIRCQHIFPILRPKFTTPNVTCYERFAIYCSLRAVHRKEYFHLNIFIPNRVSEYSGYIQYDATSTS